MASNFFGRRFRFNDLTGKRLAATGRTLAYNQISAKDLIARKSDVLILCQRGHIKVLGKGVAAMYEYHAQQV